MTLAGLVFRLRLAFHAVVLALGLGLGVADTNSIRVAGLRAVLAALTCAGTDRTSFTLAVLTALALAARITVLLRISDIDALVVIACRDLADRCLRAFLWIAAWAFIALALAIATIFAAAIRVALTMFLRSAFGFALAVVTLERRTAVLVAAAGSILSIHATAVGAVMLRWAAGKAWAAHLVTLAGVPRLAAMITLVVVKTHKIPIAWTAVRIVLAGVTDVATPGVGLDVALVLLSLALPAVAFVLGISLKTGNTGDRCRSRDQPTEDFGQKRTSCPPLNQALSESIEFVGVHDGLTLQTPTRNELVSHTASRLVSSVHFNGTASYLMHYASRYAREFLMLSFLRLNQLAKAYSVQQLTIDKLTVNYKETIVNCYM